jgi:subfamily B ATP-binding cassette protein MsbA
MHSTAGSNIKRLIRLLRPYPWLLPMLVVLGVAASLAEAIGIGLLIPLLGAVLQPADPAVPSAVERIARAFVLNEAGELRFLLVAVAIFLLILLKTLILSAYVLVATRMTGRIAKDMRVSLWDRIANAEMTWFARSDHGYVLNTIQNQTYRATEALTALNVLIVSICTVLVFGIFLFMLSVPMTLIMLAAGVPVFLLVRRLTRSVKRYGQALGDAYARVGGRVMELLTAMRTIRVFNQQAAGRPLRGGGRHAAFDLLARRAHHAIDRAGTRAAVSAGVPARSRVRAVLRHQHRDSPGVSGAALQDAGTVEGVGRRAFESRGL